MAIGIAGSLSDIVDDYVMFVDVYAITVIYVYDVGNKKHLYMHQVFCDLLASYGIYVIWQKNMSFNYIFYDVFR
jgi:hypothetical protein